MKKLYTFLLGLLVAFFTGCGSTAIVQDEVAPPKVEPIVNISTESEIEDTITESETAEVAEPTESDSQAPTIGESKYLVDGVFYPKEYARELGYTIYESSDETDSFSISRNGIEFYIAVMEKTCCLYFEKDGYCYVSTIFERLRPDYTPECKIVTGETLGERSREFFNNEKQLIEIVANGDGTNPANWGMSGTKIEMCAYNCTAQFDDDGFIDTDSFTNRDDSKSYFQSYK